MGSYIGHLVQEFIFFGGDVQTTTIVITIISSLLCSFAFLIAHFLSSPPDVSSKKKQNRGIMCNIVSTQSSMVAFHLGRRYPNASIPKRVQQSQQGSSIWQSRKIEHESCAVPCISCGVRNADKACRYILCADCCNKSSATNCSVLSHTRNAAAGLVEGACVQKTRDVDLSYLNLRQCPDRVGFIGTQLTSLNLSNNRLSALPEEIGFLRGLQELYLQYNCLKDLPDSIGNLHKLQELDLKNNCLTYLPDTIGSFEKLTYLRITNNALLTLPATIGKLTSIKEISAQSNYLVNLPDEIGNLTKLEVLYLGENRLGTLPESMGSLIRLTELDLAGCELTHLPNSLSRCSSLVRLWLSNNRLTVLPDHIGRLHQLKELHVRNNQIRYFPASLVCLELYTFTASQNNLIDRRDSKTVHSANREPEEPLPSLLEYTGRAIITSHIHWASCNLPEDLKIMLSKVRYCSSCEGPFFCHYQSTLVFRTIGISQTVPLYQQICSPHHSIYCQPVPMEQ